MQARLLAAAALVAAAVSVSAPASADPVSAGDATAGALRGGGRYVVHASALFPFATVALWYRSPQDGFGAKPAPGIARLAAEAIDVSAPIIGKPLAQRIGDLGGRLTVSTYPDSIAITAVVPATSAKDVVRLLTVAYFSPVLQDAAVRVAQRDVAQAALVRGFSSDGTLDDDLMGLLFTAGPAHAPQLGTPGGIVALEPAAVHAFAERAFRAQNAVLVLTGDVDASLVGTAATGRPATDALAAPEPAAASVPAPHPAPTSAPSLTGEAVGLGWIGPAIANEREATALDFLTDYLFRPEYGTVARALPSSVELNGRFVTYHDPGVVMVTASGTGAVAARPAIESALADAKTPLAPAAFAAARAAFLARILDDVSAPSSNADTLGWYSVEGNLPYAPGNGGSAGAYFADAAALTPEFVAATARKYLDGPGAVVTLSEAKAASS